MSFLEIVVSSSLMLCRSKNAEKKENPIFIDIYFMYIHVTTPIATMKITAYRWQAVGGPMLCAFWAAKFSFISVKTYDLGV